MKFLRPRNFFLVGNGTQSQDPITEQLEAHDPSAWCKFKLLMWKNFLQQWRHKWQTLVETLLPVLTMSLVLILRSQVHPTLHDGNSWPSIPAHTLWYSRTVLLGMNLTEISIAYSPESEVFEDVMRTSLARMFLSNINLIPDLIQELPNGTLPGWWPDLPVPDIPVTLPDWWPDLPESDAPVTLPTLPDISDDQELYDILLRIFKRVMKVHAYENSTQLRGVYADEEETRNVLAAVEFNDNYLGVTELPDDLSFSLRFPERPRLNSFFRRGGNSWRTDSMFSFMSLPGPRFPYSWEGGNDPGYVNEMFIALQHFVSNELVSRKIGEDLRNFSVHIKRLPHPPWTEDYALVALEYLFPLFIMLSYSYTAVNIARAITVEKELQLKETMKIMGLPTWLHWMAWFWKQFIFLLFSSLLVVVIIKVNWFTTPDGFSDYSVFTNTPFSILFFFITLYLACTIFFCFMLSGLFSKGSTAALFTGIIWYLTYIPAFLLGLDVSMSRAMQIFSCLSLNSAMDYGFKLIISRESTGGLQWGDFFFSPQTESTRLLFGHVVIMLCVNCVLFMLVALYLEKVFPGPFGSPHPWYFFVMPSFWCLRFKKLDDFSIDNSLIDNGFIIKEKDPVDHKIGVKIANLTKVFGRNVAVNNLTLNIYDDQITVLLGHNGAGKSTTIAMLTGMEWTSVSSGNLSVTSGSINLAGYDVIHDARSARAHLGLCPQHNVLFNELTVREHLEFFARLKGFTGKELEEDINTLITKLELEEKRDYKSMGLSGGQKRRLQVGIALTGRAKVVILDEPTSGMDPSSRRALWELLQKEKKGRSMILTTHFMDEADILGDRVAIMANGKLQCIGSPYFLKRHFGVGYTLVIVKSQGFDYEECNELINKYIPGSTIKEDRGLEVSYTLTNDHSHVFEKMLNEMENNANVIKFKNYGLVATTLEDVFMSVGSDVSPANSDIDDATTIESCTNDDSVKYELESSVDILNNDEDNVRGVALWWQHVTAVWLKLWLFWTRSWGLLLLQLSVPILIINANLGILRYALTFVSIITKRELTLETGYTQTETLLTYNGSETSSLGALAATAYEQMFDAAEIPTMQINYVNSTPIDEYYLNRTYNPADMGGLRYSMLTGATFDDRSATAWFSNFGYHDVATSLAAIYTALLKTKFPDLDFKVFNHPLETNYQDQSNLQLIVQFQSTQFSQGVGTSAAIVSAVFVMFYIKERVSRAKLLQKASGIQPFTLWFSAAVFDWAWFLIICVSIVITCLIFQVGGFNQADEIGRLYVCIIVYAAAMVPINYCASYFFNGPSTGFVSMFFINVLFGTIGPQIVEALLTPELDTEHVGNILDIILQFFPVYSLVTSVRNLHRTGLQKWSCIELCEQLSGFIPGLTNCTLETMCAQNSQCCVPENPYWKWEEPGIMRYITAMVASCVVVWVVLMVIEYRVVQKVFNRTKLPPPLDTSTMDEDVMSEIEHVEKVAAGGLGSDSLVAHGLTKYYDKHLAVDQVSFTVADRECFGLLGVNGAGKTTTFKMLMGDEMISSGDAYVSRHSVKKSINQVYRNIGYCPQFDAVFGELTGRENLRLFSMLRGMRGDSANMRADLLAHLLGFHKHMDKKVYQYSGGNKRKLSTAIALLGKTRLVFVDEPTTGVDPAAKRQVWAAIRGAQRAGRGVVLTSHSMEECEALCTRLTIMVNGRFQCIGTPQHLKNKFSQGFTLTIKLKLDEDTTANEENLNLVKAFVASKFSNLKIMEEYQGSLTYYLPDRSSPWSQMFGVMERAKAEFKIEDYCIAQTTLEQIFLQFTKYQRENKLSY